MPFVRYEGVRIIDATGDVLPCSDGVSSRYPHTVSYLSPDLLDPYPLCPCAVLCCAQFNDIILEGN